MTGNLCMAHVDMGPKISSRIIELRDLLTGDGRIKIVFWSGQPTRPAGRIEIVGVADLGLLCRKSVVVKNGLVALLLSRSPGPVLRLLAEVAVKFVDLTLSPFSFKDFHLGPVHSTIAGAINGISGAQPPILAVDERQILYILVSLQIMIHFCPVATSIGGSENGGGRRIFQVSVKSRGRKPSDVW